MKILSAKLAELKLDPKNLRIHDARNVDAVAESLDRFGQQKPIVVTADGTVVAGNATVLAAKKLNWTTVRAVRTELTAADLKAYAIADNRTGELAGWNFEQLADLLAQLEQDGQDLDALGWADYEREPIMSAAFPKPGDGQPANAPSTGKVVKFAADMWELVAESVVVMRSDPDTDSDRPVAACLADLSSRYVDGEFGK